MTQIIAIANQRGVSVRQQQVSTLQPVLQTRERESSLWTLIPKEMQQAALESIKYP